MQGAACWRDEQCTERFGVAAVASHRDDEQRDQKNECGSDERQQQDTCELFIVAEFTTNLRKQKRER